MKGETKKLNILIPIFGFSKAGGYRVLSELANNWVDCGHDVHFIAYFESELPYYPTKAKILWLNKNGDEVSHSNNLKSNNIYDALINLKSLFKFIKRQKKEYDVILANFNLTAIPVYLASKNKSYYYIQAYEPDFLPNKGLIEILFNFIAWLTYFLPLKKIVNAELYKRYKNIRCNTVIPPGLDLRKYYPKVLNEKLEDDIVVGCIGRKEEWKGSEDVGEAIKILHEKGYKIKLKVAFNPVSYKEHELVFPDGDDNLADFYRSLDILVAPGHIQLGAIHYPVIEAMACNVPVITTGYYPANDENSFIVPVKRPDKIADNIELIMNDYDIAVNKAAKAKKDIVQFDWKNVSDKFIEVFEAAIGKKK